MRVLVGIVTYFPDKEKLDRCIASVKGEDTFIFDNTEENKGIAFALKEIMNHAVKEKYDYVLTLDQDSVVKEGLISEYKSATGPEIGAMTCILEDRNFSEDQPAGDIDWCITSGCFMSVEAYKKTPGYDESLFIDMVDMDICCCLKEAGYRIVRIPFTGLEHEVGHGKNTPMGIIYNHAPWRDYYFVRNRLIVGKKHGLKHSRLKVFRDMLNIALFENNSREKLSQCKRGIHDYKKWASSNENEKSI